MELIADVEKIRKLMDMSEQIMEASYEHILSGISLDSI
jgi:hypothetical protein